MKQLRTITIPVDIIVREENGGFCALQCPYFNTGTCDLFKRGLEHTVYKEKWRWIRTAKCWNAEKRDYTRMKLEAANY